MFWSFVLSSLLLTSIGYVVIIQLLRKYLSTENYRNRKVPTGGGIVLVFAFLFTVAYYLFFSERDLIPFREWLLPLTILVAGLGFLGFIDDVYGMHGIGGFKGHFSELLKGHVTTGIIKAIGGGVICLVVAALSSAGYAATLINGLLIALLANIFNLLDLRPGRAMKLFLILGIAIFLLSVSSKFWILSGLLFGPLIILLGADLSESCMLGDAGSNVIGGIAGFAIVSNFELPVSIAALGLAILAHVYTESHSISKLIDDTPMLRKLDEIGRIKPRRIEKLQ